MYKNIYKYIKMHKYNFYTHQGQTVLPRISGKESHLANRIQLHDLSEFLPTKLFQRLCHDFYSFYQKGRVHSSRTVYPKETTLSRLLATLVVNPHKLRLTQYSTWSSSSSGEQEALL